MSALASILALAAAASPVPACAPDGLVRIVLRDVSPSIPADSFAAKPKIVYRSGDRYGRLDEEPDPALGVHGRIVTAQPDSWIVNLLQGSGQHVVDPGPSLITRFPAFMMDELPPAMRDLEFGCEAEFARARMPESAGTVEREGVAHRRHVLEDGGYRLAVFFRADDGRPSGFTLHRGDGLLVDTRYDDYRAGLPFDPELFRRPKGIRFTGPGGPEWSLDDAASFDRLFQRYYLDPRPDLIVDAIDHAGKDPRLGNDGAKGPVIGFFAEVFSRHPAHRPVWDRARERQPEPVHSWLREAAEAAVEPKTAFDAMPSSPTRNDVFWGAYFATGDPDYLLRLLDEMRRLDGGDDLWPYLTAASAKWSLASNARQHDKVRADLEAARAGADARRRRDIEAVLTTDPAAVRDEMQEWIQGWKKRQGGR